VLPRFGSAPGPIAVIGSFTDRWIPVMTIIGAACRDPRSGSNAPILAEAFSSVHEFEAR
jgi:hypothetical protein